MALIKGEYTNQILSTVFISDIINGNVFLKKNNEIPVGHGAPNGLKQLPGAYFKLYSRLIKLIVARA